MCVKARRIVIGILFLTGAVVAYPQSNFPEHLNQAGNYINLAYQFPKGITGKIIYEKWKDYSSTPLSKAQAKSMEEGILLLNYLAETLPKEDQLFINKHGHLSIFLSGLYPQLVGEYDRSGPWMLSYPDARRYGLTVNEFVDERRDFAKSTYAARLLFADLKKEHGANTEAAFVLGSAGWSRARKEKINKVEEELTGLRLLAKSTQPAELTVIYDDFIVQRFQEDIDIAILLANTSTSEGQFQRLNPTIIGSTIPAKYDVRLESIVDGHLLENATQFFADQKKRRQDSIMLMIKNDIPSPETHQVITYRVKSGDVLGKISEKYGVSVAKIKKWNDLRSDRIDINQKLTIYYPKGKQIPTKTMAKAAAPPKEETKIQKEELEKYTIYEVQPGDTLWAISKRFEGVKPEQIMAWNGIGEDLSIGQKLKIKVQ